MAERKRLTRELKIQIKEAISAKSKYKATKVWKIQVDENFAGECTMWIEVAVKKKAVAP